MGYNHQESLENTINTIGTLLGVHPSLSLDFPTLSTAKALPAAGNTSISVAWGRRTKRSDHPVSNFAKSCKVVQIGKQNGEQLTWFNLQGGAPTIVIIGVKYVYTDPLYIYIYPYKWPKING